MNNTRTSSLPGMKANWLLCFVLLCIVGIEVFLTYQHLSTGTLLAFLLVLAFFEAAIAVTYAGRDAPLEFACDPLVDAGARPPP